VLREEEFCCEEGGGDGKGGGSVVEVWGTEGFECYGDYLQKGVSGVEDGERAGGGVLFGASSRRGFLVVGEWVGGLGRMYYFPGERWVSCIYQVWERWRALQEVGCMSWDHRCGLGRA